MVWAMVVMVGVLGAVVILGREERPKLVALADRYVPEREPRVVRSALVKLLIDMRGVLAAGFFRLLTLPVERWWRNLLTVVVAQTLLRCERVSVAEKNRRIQAAMVELGTEALAIHFHDGPPPER